MGCLLGSGFLKPGAVCSLTIWKKLSDHLRCKDGWRWLRAFAALERRACAAIREREVVGLGLDCMYRLLPLSSIAMGATQALRVRA